MNCTFYRIDILGSWRPEITLKLIRCASPHFTHLSLTLLSTSIFVHILRISYITTPPNSIVLRPALQYTTLHASCLFGSRSSVRIKQHTAYIAARPDRSKNRELQENVSLIDLYQARSSNSDAADDPIDYHSLRFASLKLCDIVGQKDSAKVEEEVISIW